jgi:GAF domain-containing protein
MPRFQVHSRPRSPADTQSPGRVVEADNWMVAADLCLEERGLPADALAHLRCDVEIDGAITVTAPLLGLHLRLVELLDGQAPGAADPAGAEVDAPDPGAVSFGAADDPATEARIALALAHAEAIATAPDDAGAAELALAALLRVVPAQSGAVLLLRGRDELEFVAAVGPHRNRLVGTRMPAALGIAGLAVRTGRSVRVRGAERHPAHYSGIDRLLHHHTRALLAAPIHREGAVVGALELLNPFGEQPFLEWHQDAAMLVAGRLGRRLAG